jgi:peptide/nickel transport system ATP-binding protein
MPENNYSDNNTMMQIHNLSISYGTHHGLLRAVDDVSLQLRSGKIYALVGESGCGKSTLGLALSRLLPESQVEYSGKILFDRVDMLSLREEEVEQYRGTKIATIFQEPMTSLNPVYKVGEQIAEALWIKDRRSQMYDSSRTMVLKPDPLSRLVAINSHSLKQFLRRNLYQLYSSKVRDLLEKVKIPNPDRIAGMYPHELSGGMKQRVMIAMALAEGPSLLVADEPTTALDVTTQTQILNLIRSLNSELHMTVLLITHDLGVVAAIADYAIVMYAGKLVESAPTHELFENPLHPYTVGLMASFPKGGKGSLQFTTIRGTVPPLGHYPSGCRFHPRCEKAFGKCPTAVPEYRSILGTDHVVSCFLYDGEE